DALAAAVQALSPGLASLGDDESGEAAVDRLLREVVTAVASRRPEWHVVDPDGAAGDRAAPARTTDEAQLRALARALLSGAEVRRFKVQSRRDAWRWYRLTDDGGIVTCDCSGFQYRGACSHARGLKLALASGGELPPGVEEVTG
ncbi:MAG TPA: SWIM zinc finger family protein, partial [Gemmatimonadaceae bacterium]|nr:SWIM zinc finger family protein [Gemmatimonadaceae bacterium]